MIRCAVLGGSGYIGGELIKLLLSHPHTDLVSVTANEMAGTPIVNIHPHLRPDELVFNPLDEINDAEVIFLALPHGSAIEQVKKFTDKTIIDTSADFRLQNK